MASTAATLLERRGEVQLIETVHLRHVRDRRLAALCERPAEVGLRVALHDEHRVVGHVRDDVTPPLVLGIAWRDDVHDKMSNAAIGSERDLGVPLLHARKAVHLVTRQRIAAARHAFDRDGVLAEAGNEAVSFRGLISAARCEREGGEDESLHENMGNGRPTRSADVLTPARGAQANWGRTNERNSSG